MQEQLQETSALPAPLRLPGRMNETIRDAYEELREDPLTALWLAGNVLGFLVLLWLLFTA